jgi:hypothetical protein
MMIRALTLKQSQQFPSSANGLQFEDASRISSWAQEAVKAAVEAKLLQGDGTTFLPQAKATRAESAQVLYALINMME